MRSKDMWRWVQKDGDEVINGDLWVTCRGRRGGIGGNKNQSKLVLRFHVIYYLHLTKYRKYSFPKIERLGLLDNEQL